MEQVGVRVSYACPTMPLTLFTLQIPPAPVPCYRGTNKASWTRSSRCVALQDHLQISFYVLIAFYSRCMVLPIFASQIYPLFPFRLRHTLNVCAPASFALQIQILTSSCHSYRICDWRERCVWFPFRLRLWTNSFNCSSR